MSGVERGQGVPCWRAELWERREGGMRLGTIIRENLYLGSPEGDRLECRAAERMQAFPTDEASLAQIRERIAVAINDGCADSGRPIGHGVTYAAADAVMRLLFGQGVES